MPYPMSVFCHCVHGVAFSKSSMAPRKRGMRLADRLEDDDDDESRMP